MMKNRKIILMLIPMMLLLMTAVPTVLAGSVHIEGDGVYSQTLEFGEISDAVTLTGDWVFDSAWSHSSRGDIDNNVILEELSSYSEYAVSPAGSDGLDLQTIVNYGTGSIQDVADIEVRGFNFAFEASTNSPYESTKHLNILDSYNYYTGGSSGNDQVPDESGNRDTATFQVTDTSSSIYVVGGNVEYIKPYGSSIVSSGKVTLDQTFTNSSSDASVVTSNFFATSHIVSTAYFGYTAGSNINDLDWYGEAVMDIKGNNKHDKLFAYFDDDEADFFLKWSSCGTNYDSGVQKGKNHPMELSAYGDVDFTASGNAEDVGSAGWPSGYSKSSGTYEAPTDQWTFTGTNFYKYDANSINWLASFDMEP